MRLDQLTVLDETVGVPSISRPHEPPWRRVRAGTIDHFLYRYGVAPMM
jgi:hypothetical protein